MDFDQDGKLDFVSGSYDPGEVFLFRGAGKGRFALGEMLFDAGGVPLVHHPEEFVLHERLRRERDDGDPAKSAAMVASYGSFPMPIDLDADGDLDMLIGSLSGEVFWREGIAAGKRGRRGAKTTFAAASVPLEADGVRLKVHSHADPFAADWDGDGLVDLVVGAGDGSVGWYRNEGSAQAPSLGPRRGLVSAKSTTDQVARTNDAQGLPLPGTRAQICVADYDGDGRVDLLVGDFATAGAASRAPTSYIWLYRRSGPITPR